MVSEGTITCALIGPYNKVGILNLSIEKVKFYQAEMFAMLIFIVCGHDTP